MNPDYMPSYGRWPDYTYLWDDGPSYPTPSKTYRKDRQLLIANKKRKAREQRRKMKRHNRRRK